MKASGCRRKCLHCKELFLPDYRNAQRQRYCVKEQGYSGRYTILGDFVRQVRPKPRPAFLTLHFEPGQCAQVDWGFAGWVPVGSTRRRLSFFLMVLAFSRKMYLEFTLAETLEQFNWTWPKKIDRAHVQSLLRLSFLKEKANVIFMGGAGLGKTHLATALAYEGCLAGHTVLFTTAIDIVNTLVAAQGAHRLKAELKKHLAPSIVLIDELGYLPIDKTGADLLFQVFSQRYETGSTLVTTNQAYKNRAKVFNNDATLTSAVLDRLLHHAETVIIEGRSYRMKDQIQEP